MDKKHSCCIFAVLLIAVLGMPYALFAQSSAMETWKGIQVLQFSKNDFIGVPGEVTISLTKKGGIWRGNIRARGIFYGETLQNINYQAKKFTASFNFRFARETFPAKLLLFRDDIWMYGIIKLGTKIGHTDYLKLYIKKE